MDTVLAALRVELAGDVTSFRYPHFTQGFQPTYYMPPPSTIYGMVCSALGRYLTDEERAKLRFGYIFKHAGKFVDYMEHLHFGDPIQPFPFDRELLFQPRLILYLTGLSLEAAFRAPRYMMVMGRSQDLMGIESVMPVTLTRAAQGYLEHTLLPMWMATRLPKNITVATMARYINSRRQAEWGRYALLQDVVEAYPPIEASNASGSDDWGDEDEPTWEFEGDELELWAEPDSLLHPRSGLPRTICLHRFTEETV